jgi:hypothetical protein
VPEVWYPGVNRSQNGRAEPCSNCASLASRSGLYAGLYWIIAGLAIVVLLVYYCIRLING